MEKKNVFVVVGFVLFQSLTLLPGLSDDVSSTLTHHLGDIERAVGLIGHSYRAVYRLGLHLEKREIFNEWPTIKSDLMTVV